MPLMQKQNLFDDIKKNTLTNNKRPLFSLLPFPPFPILNIPLYQDLKLLLYKKRLLVRWRSSALTPLALA